MFGFTVHRNVSWSPGEQKFELSMKSGSVIVEGPLIDGGIALKRGQRLSGGLGSQKLVVEDVKSDAPSAPTAEAVPAPSDDPAAQRLPFRRLRELSEGLRRDGLRLDTLSMGMSADFPAAIAEGATLVRIGSALFGARSP